MKCGIEMLQIALDEARFKFPELPIIFGGDMNARVGTIEELPAEIFLGSRLNPEHSASDSTINQKGKLFLEFIDSNGFILINGRTNSDSPANLTFVNTRGSND